ncbi:MAG: response regulator [Thermodesulfobacteriota bacterium]
MTAVDIPTLFLDRDLRILRFTPQARNLFNILHTDRGRPLTDLTHRLGDNRLQKDARRVLDRLAPVERELQSEGGRWYLTRVLPYRTEQDRIEGVVIILIDITDRKRAEAALRRLNETLEQQVLERTQLAEARTRQLQRLAVELIEAEERERRRIAHLLHDDLQQDLASVRMQLQAVCRNLKDVPMLEKIDRLLSESIEKSRQVSHELCPPVLHHSDLMDVFRWLIRQMETQFGLSVRLKADSPPRVENGPLKVFLFRAVQELLFNIHKHAGEKEADLLISGARDRLMITVQDYGTGFDPETLKSADADTGLGLLSLRERARFIGGKLEVESTPGKGSRFTLSIPIDLSHPQDTEAFPPVAGETLEVPVRPEDSEKTGLIRMVFVDDHEVMRKGLIRMISDQPAIEVVGEAENGRDALDLVRRVHPDVVVMDINMPAMDGIEATRRIKSEQPHIRVIGLSMSEDEEIVRTMKQAGAEAFVSKTAGSGELLQAIYNLRDGEAE